MNKSICRICLKDGELSSIFGKEHEIPLPEKIMSCTSVTIEPNDDLPSKICNKCIDHLNISYHFKLQCIESDIKLRNEESFNKNKDAHIDQLEIETQTNQNGLKSKKKVKNKKTGEFETKVCRKREIKDESCAVKQESSTKTESISENDDIINDTCSSDGDFNEKQTTKNHKHGECDKKPNKEQCSTCGRIMSTRFRLRMHMRTHTGERPHSCNVCGRSFSLAQSLKVHVRTHSGEKPLVCTVCGRAFAQYSGLAAHSRLHTGVLPYHCYICGQNFRTTGHLNYHIRKHTGEKKFECNICQRAFIMQADLKQHVKIHTGEKKYICIVCGIRMTRSSHLTRHMLTHSKEKSHVWCHVHTKV